MEMPSRSTLLVTIMAVLISIYIMSGQLNILDGLESSNRKPGSMFDEYDFIVVGGGSAGLKDQKCPWPRGKVIGGSSVLNYMVYLRGNRRDFDGWEALGNEGWGYDQVLPYFKKSEDNRNLNLTKTPYHSSGGYLTVEEAPYHTPHAPLFIQAGKELGYEEVDLNGAGNTGFMITQGTLRRGSRCSTAKPFLRPVRKRTNLHISMNSQVTKIIINPKTKAANGIEFINDGLAYQVTARKEVILSTGSVSSPHLLMLSGVGPKKHLELKGIHAIHDLPGVGENLQDHLTIIGAYFLTNKSLQINGDGMLSTSSFFDYLLQGKGPLTSNIVEAVAFIKSKNADYSESYPDIEIHFHSMSLNPNSGDTYTNIYGIKEEIYDELFSPIEGRSGWSAPPALLHPRSRGFIRLNSNSPFDPPEIQPNYFSDPHDIKVLVEGIKFSIQLSKTETFQKFDSHINNATISACREKSFGSDEYWECFTRHITQTVYHPVGTCKMGPKSDPSAVVDPQLRVHGMSGLRVIDASIMPKIVGANTFEPLL